MRNSHILIIAKRWLTPYFNIPLKQRQALNLSNIIQRSCCLILLIGATAHYVTADLDEGPIIEQMVERVSHSHDSEHLTLVGRDTEAQTLARAVKNHVRHRVFLNGLRTVVF